MERRGMNILLELIGNIIVKYPDTEEYIQEKLQEKRKREGTPIETVNFIFLTSFRIRNGFIVIYKMLRFCELVFICLKFRSQYFTYSKSVIF